MIDAIDIIDDIKEKNLVDSLLSSERILSLKEKEDSVEYDIDNISKWLDLKSLIKEKGFKQRLNIEGIDEKDFNLGIKELNDDEREILLDYVKESDWFKYFEEIMSVFEEVDESAHKNGSFENINVSYIIRPFMYTIEKNILETINSLNNFKLNENAIQQIMNTFTTKLFMFFNKVFIIELNSAKTDSMLKGDTGEERFKYFIKNFFESKNQLLRFYYEYPVLTRLVTTKTKFMLDFITQALENIDNNYEDIQNLYTGKELKVVEEISASEGDSHEQGKSVIIFTFDDNTKLIYKPRDLRVIEAYNEFIDWINKSSGLLDIAKTNGIYYDNYSFEKFVEYKECDNEQHIKNYYRRFGHVVALAHTLSTNDLHSENLIAAGQYPTIIDLETIIQAEPQLEMSSKERAGAVIKQDIFMNSVQFTALLPQIVFNNNKEGKGIDISALDGKASKLPFKILSPVNIKTDEYRLDYQYHMTEGSNNIPILNGKPIYFNEYKDEISLGFKEMMKFFMDSKDLLLSEDSKLNLFRGKIVRNVLKGTQLYMNMLNYSSHPNYSQDMLAREKLIENIWSYPYKNKEVIKHEYNDMMYDDIPVFFSYTDSKDILSSDKSIIKDYFPESGLSKVYQRIGKLSIEEIQKQKSILEVTLGKYDDVIKDLKGNRDYLNSSNLDIDVLKEAKEIGDFIISKGVYSEQGNQISWADITMSGKDRTKWEASNIDCSVYDGLSGVALFFLELYSASKEDKYFEVYEKSMASAIREADFDNNISAYGGKVSILFPILNEIQKTGKSKFSYYIEDIKTFIKEKINDTEEMDWLGGNAGVIALMLNTYELLSDKECLDISIELGKKILSNVNIQELNDVGYAHGCSGIAVALIRLYECCDNKDFLDKANKLIKRERELVSDKDYKEQSKWCWGSTGIGLNRLEIYKKYNDKSMLPEIEHSVQMIEETMKKNDCLCHGNMSDIELLNQYSQLISDKNDLINKKLSDVYLNKIKSENYSVRCMPQFTSVSLFTGLSGIGYQLLRLHNPNKISNVLTLTLGK